MKPAVRFLAALLLALTLAMFSGTATAKPAHAAGGACGFFDSDGVLYSEQVSGSPRNDGAFDIAHGGGTFWVSSDLWVYRYGTNGHCYRGYYSSIWTSGGQTGTMFAVVRAWICGIGVYNFPGTVNHNSNNAYMITTSNWVDAHIEVTIRTRLPNGVWNNLTLARYDGCGPQADNYPGYADDGANGARWSPPTFWADNSKTPSLYLNR